MKTSYRKPKEATEDECKEWKNSTGARNPITKRSIKKGSKIYEELVKNCGKPKYESKSDKLTEDDCIKWIISGKKKNPSSNRKIKEGGKVYKKLEEDCKDVNLKKKTPYKYQEENINGIIKLLEQYGRAINISEMGTGKTIVGINVAKKLGMKLMVLCPKAVRETWYDEIKRENLPIITVTNFESIKGTVKSSPKCYDKNDKKKECNIVSLEYKKNKKGKHIPVYIWKIPKNTLVIVDESHKAKNLNSATSRMIISLAESIKENQKMLIMSATPIEKETNYNYLKKILMLPDDNVKEEIKKRMLRMTIEDYKKEIGEDVERIDIQTKKIKISPETALKLEKKYSEIIELRENMEQENALAIMQKLREEIELLKTDVFIEQVENYLEKDKSVILFLNFRRTISKVEKYFKDKEVPYAVIHGDVSEQMRRERIKLFQDNKIKLVIITIATGGTGINLQDKSGKHPRVSIISPSWSMTDLVQTFGRTERVLTKSQPKAYIIFAGSNKNSIEFYIADVLKEKLKNLGDLIGENLEDLINVDINE